MVRVLMCAPSHYSINYEINPWMKLSNAIDPVVARQQWDGLYGILRKLGVTILLVPQQKRCPDMVFTANAGVVEGPVFIPAHFRFKERQGETAAFTRFFKKHKYRISDVTKGLFWEGEGDFLPYRDYLFGGFRFRSELAAHERVAEALHRRVIGLELAEPHFYHLDTCFFPLDERTAFYYPGAFDRYGRRAIERFVENPVPVPKEDAHRFACNAFRVGRRVVLNQVSQKLKARFEKLGYETIETPTSEFVKAGGSVKCLLLRL
jgi:N-dimethylarginine dimethylaminohydrolase